MSAIALRVSTLMGAPDSSMRGGPNKLIKRPDILHLRCLDYMRYICSTQRDVYMNIIRNGYYSKLLYLIWHVSSLAAYGGAQREKRFCARCAAREPPAEPLLPF